MSVYACMDTGWGALNTALGGPLPQQQYPGQCSTVLRLTNKGSEEKKGPSAYWFINLWFQLRVIPLSQ